MTTLRKPRVAFFDFTGCEGCQLTAIDALQKAPQMLSRVDIVQFREAMSEKSDDYQIAFIEGSCSRLEDERRLKEIRQNANFVIALGACAHLGGVNSLSKWHTVDQLHRRVYGEVTKNGSGYPARPIDSAIAVDGVLPGCPIDRQEFIGFVTVFLQAGLFHLPDYPVCVECRLKENLCIVSYGKACLGSITRAGCGAICPTFGIGCDGCRGAFSDPNYEWLKAAFRDHGISQNVYDEKMKFFQSYQYSHESKTIK